MQQDWLPSERENFASSLQGNLLGGIVNWSGAAQSTVSVTFFLYFNLKQKTVFRSNVTHLWFPFRKYILEKIFYQKKLKF